MCHNKDTETKNSHLFYLLASAQTLRPMTTPKILALKLNQATPQGENHSNFIFKIDLIFFS